MIVRSFVIDMDGSTQNVATEIDEDLPVELLVLRPIHEPNAVIELGSARDGVFGHHFDPPATPNSPEPDTLVIPDLHGTRLSEFVVRGTAGDKLGILALVSVAQ